MIAWMTTFPSCFDWRARRGYSGGAWGNDFGGLVPVGHFCPQAETGEIFRALVLGGLAVFPRQTLGTGSLEQGAGGAERREICLGEFGIEALRGFPAAARGSLMAEPGVRQGLQGERDRRHAGILVHVAGGYQELVVGQLSSLPPFPGMQQIHDGNLIVRHVLHAAIQMRILGGRRSGLPWSFLGCSSPGSQGEHQERKESHEFFPGHGRPMITRRPHPRSLS